MLGILSAAWAWLVGSPLGRALAALALAVGAVKGAHMLGKREGAREAEQDVEARYRRAVDDTLEDVRRVDDRIARMTDDQVDAELERWTKQ